MRVSAQAEYALRAMIDIARTPDKSVRLSDIAERKLIPASFLPTIASKLARAGLLTTQRGVGGGVRLACSPHGITALDVIIAVEGPLFLYSCLKDTTSCPLSSDCSLHTMLVGAQQAMLEVFQTKTLADLAREAKPYASVPGPVEVMTLRAVPE